MEKDKKLLIVGAGPSGLTSAKYAIQNGFEPIVLQKNSEIGGVWNQETGITWSSMRTNLSKYSCSFVDFPWNEEDDMFVPTRVMQDYFLRYAQHFNLRKYIRFNCQVIKIDLISEQSNSQQYEIEWLNEHKTMQKLIVSRVIVANGIFDRPFYPQLPGLNNFKGKVLHSHDYREGKDFKDQNVLVIGGSFTGIELSADLSRHTKQLYHSFRKPFILLGHYISIEQNKKLPIDLVVLKWLNIYAKSLDKDIEARLLSNKFLLSLSPKQQEIPDIKVDQEDLKQPLFLAISTDYLPNINKKLISPKRGVISGFKQNSVIFEDGDQQKQASQILCN